MTETIELAFSESNAEWAKNPDANEMFLQLQENYHNMRLQTRGHVFLNELLDTLGFPATREGTCGGWVLTGTPAYIDIQIGKNDKGTIPVTLTYQENILDDVWPEGA
jgi:hypothetical protein